MLLPVLLCVGVAVVAVDNRLENEGFLVPKHYSDSIERFDDLERQKTYLFWFQKHGWETARLLCSSQRAGLAEPQTLDEVNFLYQAMSESEQTDFEDMWIGGRQLDDGKTFSYLHSRIPLSLEQQEIRDTCLNFTEETKDVVLMKFFNRIVARKCLALDRKGHDTAQFVNLDCENRRPFICEKAMDPFMEPIPLWPRFKSDGLTYLLVRARATWEQAVVWCLTNKLRLATTDNMKNVRDIAYQMLRTRPVIENAWLGGHYNSDHHSWEWLHWPTSLGFTRNVVTGYPPWHRGSPSINNGAVLIDRHISTDAVFIPARVTRPRDFVCMDEPAPVSPVQWFQISNDWFIYLGKVPWNQVQVHCKVLAPNITDEKKKPQFLMLKTKEQLEKLVHLVAWLHLSIQHLWLGAQMQIGTKQWSWTDNTTFANEYKFLPWCEPYNETWDVHRCLNFDREDHYRPVVYGLACHFMQNFICEVPELQCSAKECKVQMLEEEQRSGSREILVDNTGDPDTASGTSEEAAKFAEEVLQPRTAKQNIEVQGTAKSTDEASQQRQDTPIDKTVQLELDTPMEEEPQLLPESHTKENAKEQSDLYGAPEVK